MERRERLEAIEEREYNVGMREAIRLAIRLKDSLTELGTDVGSGPAREHLPQDGQATEGRAARRWEWVHASSRASSDQGGEAELCFLEEIESKTPERPPA